MSLAASSAVSLAAGLAMSLAFPPAEIWPLAFVALAPLLWCLRDAGPGRGFVLGLVFGLAFYGVTLYWILQFGLMAWTALTLVSGLSAGVFGLLYPLVRRAGNPVLTAFGAASLWTAVDWVRGMWPLGGFTWGSLGVSQVDNRVTLRLAAVAGVWGMTLLVVAVNGLVVTTLSGGGGGRRRAGLVTLVAALALAPIAIPFATADGIAIDVAALQVDVREAAEGSTAEEDIRVASLNIDLHGRLAGDPPDLALWGEGALDPAATDDPAVRAAVEEVVARVGAPTLIGAVTNDRDGRQRTDVLLFDGAGRQVDRYDKVHLVPFGEYVPFRDRLSWIEALDQVPVDRAPGEGVRTVTTGGLPPFGAPICFENSFPALPRAFVNEGAEFLVVTVNNASYGFTAASDQHLQMSRIRAAETGRWVVNAAVSGISAFVDPSGRIVSEVGLFEPAILRRTIRSSDERTWYVRLGDWLPWLSLLFVASMAAAPRRRTAQTPAPEPLTSGFRTLAILPTYDERATVEQVLRGVLKAPQGVHVVVVDDSSPDGTAQVVRDMAAAEPRIRLIERPEKSGLASAYLEGFRMALDEGYDLVVEMDSDLSHDPSELPRLLDTAAARDHLTVGSRYVPGGSVTNWSRARVALSRAGNLYARFMLGLPVHDATSGYRAYRRELLTDLVRDPFSSDGYGFQIELVMRAWHRGYAVGETPITFREREHGHSKISRGIVVEALWLVTRWGIAQRFRPTSGARTGS